MQRFLASTMLSENSCLTLLSPAVCRPHRACLEQFCTMTLVFEADLLNFSDLQKKVCSNSF